MPFDGAETKTDAQIDLLNAARIIRERGLSQGVYENEGKVCFWGALDVARGVDWGVTQYHTPKELKDLIYHEEARREPMFFSDAPGRTAEEVARRLEYYAR